MFLFLLDHFFPPRSGSYPDPDPKHWASENHDLSTGTSLFKKCFQYKLVVGQLQEGVHPTGLQRGGRSQVSDAIPCGVGRLVDSDPFYVSTKSQF